MTRAEAVAALNSHTGFFRHWIGRTQRMVLMRLVEGEEGEAYVELLTALKARIEAMPKTYETDAIDMKDKIVHLHYFLGSVDAWIVEKDKGDGFHDIEQSQAFGAITTSGEKFRDAEWGYISIVDLIDNDVEIDLHWTPKPAKEC